MPRHTRKPARTKHARAEIHARAARRARHHARRRGPRADWAGALRRVREERAWRLDWDGA